MPDLTPTKTVESQNQRCYRCFRPLPVCYCDSIPEIENRTNVLIIQDRRERFHPFNTARMVHRALNNSSLFVDRSRALAKTVFPFSQRAALLFPGPDARLLSDIPTEELPDQIVAIDGTWHHAKQVYRELECLHGLPQFMIAPAKPGNFRIRREPNEQALSTVEAIVAALQTLEPETKGFEKLIATFTRMVDDQLAHPKPADGMRFNRKRKGTPFNVPLALVSSPESVVVVYGESVTEEGECGEEPKLIYWVAKRLGSDEVFSSTIAQPKLEISDRLYTHMELEPDFFSRSLRVEEFAAAWNKFLRPEDTLAAYNKNTFQLLDSVGLKFSGQKLVLKSVDLKNGSRNGHLNKLLIRENVSVGPTLAPGRAGRRLAGAVALAKHLGQINPDG